MSTQDTRLIRSLTIALVAMGALALASCKSANEPTDAEKDLMVVGTSSQGLTAGASYTAADVQTAYNRAQRIRDLLANCSGSAASGAGAAAEQMKQAQMSLGNIVSGVSPNTPAARDSAIGAMLDAQAVAYNAAVSCGLVQPGVPDPGGWNATWDDISS